MGERCDALKDGKCKNGFPVTGACQGAAGTPVCCNEALCGRLYEAFGGKPPTPHAAPPPRTP